MKLVLVLVNKVTREYVVNRVGGRDWPVAFTSSVAAEDFMQQYELGYDAEVVAREPGEIPFTGQWLDFQFTESKEKMHG